MSERDELGDALSIATATGRALHGDVIDLGAADVGLADLYFVAIVDTAVTSAGAATVDFEFVSAVDGTATTHFRSGPIAKAKLIAGFRVMAVKLSQLHPLPERFVGLITNPAVAALTAGKLNSFLTPTPAGWQAFDSPAQEF